MEVLLLFIIFLDVHLAGGWTDNLEVDGPSPPPESSDNPLTRPRRYVSQARHPRKYHPLPRLGARFWDQFESIEDDTYSEDDPFQWNDDDDFPPVLDVHGKTLPAPQTCVTTALVSSGVTALTILAVVTILFKLLPSVYIGDPFGGALDSFLRAVAEAWLSTNMQIPPEMMQPVHTWSPKRPYHGYGSYGPRDYRPSAPYRK